MSGLNADSVDAAIARARTALGLEAGEPARGWSVGRMREGAHDFILVVFGPSDRSSAIAAVDAVSGEVIEAARLPGHVRHALLTAEQAIQRAGFGPDTDARLVWDPSPASRSRFYPLWRLQSAGRRAWVDSVRGEVWQTLDTRRGGGSSDRGP
jgi:hypothetical protein